MLFKNIISQAAMSNRKILCLLLAVLTAQLLSACSIDYRFEEIGQSISAVVQKEISSNKEIVPTSQQGAVTTAGYTVQSSVGFYAGALEVVTADGYKVNSGVQSNIFR